MQSLTKENASIASIYSRNTDPNKYTIICCCQDGFYRVFEFDLAYLEEPSNEDDDDEHPSHTHLSSQLALNCFGSERGKLVALVGPCGQ